MVAFLDLGIARFGWANSSGFSHVFLLPFLRCREVFSPLPRRLSPHYFFLWWWVLWSSASSFQENSEIFLYVYDSICEESPLFNGYLRRYQRCCLVFCDGIMKALEAIFTTIVPSLPLRGGREDLRVVRQKIPGPRSSWFSSWRADPFVFGWRGGWHAAFGFLVPLASPPPTPIWSFKPYSFRGPLLPRTIV